MEYITKFLLLKPNSAGLLNVAWVRGGTMCPHLLDHPKTPPIIFGFSNELGKFKKFRTSRPLFSWRNSRLIKIAGTLCPPASIGLINSSYKRIYNLWWRVYLLIILGWYLSFTFYTFIRKKSTILSTFIGDDTSLFVVSKMI